MITTLRKPLTMRQNEIYNFIHKHWQENGCTPTCQEICERFGFTSRNCAKKHMANLASKGYLESMGDRVSRAYVPTDFQRGSKVDFQWLQRATGLTTARAETLWVIVNGYRKGRLPTFREVARVRAVSPNAVVQAYRALLSDGWIVRRLNGNGARNVRLSPRTLELLKELDQ